MEGVGAFPLNRLSAPLGTHNAVLRARSRAHFVEDFPGPLSIKSVTDGTVAWKTGGRELSLDRDSFMVLQDGEPYSMEIDSRRPVGTLCLFFQRGFMESLYESLTSSEVDGEPPSPLPLLSRMHMGEGRVLPRMRAMANTRQCDRLWIDQQFLHLGCDLLMLDRHIRRRVRLLPARRAATRLELFRRVCRVQEFLHADPVSDLDLTQLARESCLSPYHFHRAFTCAFGRTPHQYRNDLRLARARRLLEETDLTVTEVCGAVGFQSAPSFSTLFRQTYGVPPSSSRKRYRHTEAGDSPALQLQA